MVDYEKVAEVLFTAHDDIRKNGLARGRLADETGAHCTHMAIAEATVKYAHGEMLDLGVAARDCIRDVIGEWLIARWSDESPVEVVLDGLQAAGKIALRKADER